MTNPNNEEVFIDPNTDDLDQFEQLFSGKAKAKVEEPELDEDAQDELEDADVGEDTTPQEEDKSEEEPAEEPKPEKKKSRFQERIDELTARNKEQERLFEAQKAQLEAAIAKITELADKPKEAAPAVAEVGQPQPTDLNEDGTEKYALGEFDPKFIKDLTKWTIATETAAAETERQAKIEVEKQQQAAQALQTEWATKLDKAKADHPEIVESNQKLQDTFQNLDPAYGEYLAMTIMSMDYGTDVLRYLGQNIEEAKSIAASGPQKATILLGRLEAQFASQQEKKPQVRVSNAPTPPPASRGSGGNRDIQPDTDDLEAFEKLFYK